MSKSFRFASAASLAVLGTVLAGCATSNRSNVREVKASGEVGMATRALVALNANDFTTAVGLAERAVEKTPGDAGFRALLGSAYFGAGRFASAESAFRDSLTINSQQPKLVLKLALAQIAQGKNGEALAVLDSARDLLEPADLGLALALAGRANEAVPVLESAARVPHASPRIRQNLALAFGLAGDWAQARVVAAQDVPANELDARIDQWMRIAKPTRPYEQLAALTGITVPATDPGQPVQLALRQVDTRQAAVAPAPQAEPAPQPQMVAAAAAAAPEPAPQYFAPPPPPPAPPPVAVADPEPAVPEFVAASAPEAVYSPPPPAPVRAQPKRPPVRKAALPVRRGNSNSVIQLGSYRSQAQVAAAWATLTQRYPALRTYLPMRARFDSANGTYWRLSIRGFADQRDAQARCQLLKSRGGNCFVRTIAGDAPVQIAAR